MRFDNIHSPLHNHCYVNDAELIDIKTNKILLVTAVLNKTEANSWKNENHFLRRQFCTKFLK